MKLCALGFELSHSQVDCDSGCSHEAKTNISPDHTWGYNHTLVIDTTILLNIVKEESKFKTR